MSTEKQKVGANIGTDDTGDHFNPEPETKLVAPVSKAKVKEDPLMGTVIGGRYRITGKLGQGGMGVVYKGRQEAVDRDVAIKVLLQELVEDESLVQRFHLEARAASRLSHPNTITIYDFGQHEDLLYIAMEYLHGQPLNTVLKQGPMPPARVIHIMMQALRSLSEAHKKGIVHRDIKPDNIYLTEMGGVHDFVKVLDFGVAKLKSSGEKTLTKAGMIFGTPKYMSPEQARSQELDARSDIYALGVMMYQMLMGRVPFDADDHVSILLKHVTEPPPPFGKIRPDLHVPKEFQDLVFRAMEKNVKDRYQSADEMLMALEGLAMQLQIPLGTAAYPIMATGMQPMATASLPPGSNPTPVPERSPITGEHPNTTDGVASLPSPTMRDSAMDLGITVLPGTVEAPVVVQPPRSNTVLIIGVVVAAVLLLGAGVGAFLALTADDPKPDVPTEAKVEPPKEEPPKAEPPKEELPVVAATPDAGTEAVVAEGDVKEADAGAGGSAAEGLADGKPAADVKEETPPVNDTPPSRDDERKAPANVTINILSIPPGAAVFEGSEALGSTPLTITRPGTGRSALLTFKLPGFQTTSKAVSLRRNDSVKAIMRRDDNAGGGAQETPVKKDPPKDPPKDNGGSSVKEGIDVPY